MKNEKRLIDANELFSEIERRFCLNCNFFDGKCRECQYAEVADMLVDAPTVDATEVKRGRWELHGNDDDCGCSYFCSNCHNSFDEDWFYACGQYRHHNYCPNCGAKMDGDGNEID